MEESLFIIGNWKMYKTATQAVGYINELLPLVDSCSAHVFLAVPFTALAFAADAAEEGRVVIGAQNMHDAKEGAFTGEISAGMLKDVGAQFVILGHSERRRLFHEDNEMIHRKVVAALKEEILPILCIGETLEERESGREEEVLREQLLHALKDISAIKGDDLIIAYEPVWAIGTGKSATAKMAGSAHEMIRKLLCIRFGDEIGSGIPILYGGSVNKDIIKELMGEKEINGVLVGGASLDPKTFASIAIEATIARKHS